MKQSTNTSLRIGRALLVALALGFAATSAAFASSGTRYYVNDHLATTVGISDAAGEIAAMEADAFGSPLAGGGNPVRFTGKPYDEDLGAYVFPFRNYRAEEGRWMSADPSGFPDGVNGRQYAPDVFLGVDPLGLWTVHRVSGVSQTDSYSRRTVGSFNLYVYDLIGSGHLAASPGGGSSANVNWSTTGVAQQVFIPNANYSADTFAGALGVTVGVNSDGTLTVDYTNKQSYSQNIGHLSLTLGITHEFNSAKTSVSFNFSWGIAHNGTDDSLSVSANMVTASSGSSAAGQGYNGGVNTIRYESRE